MATRFAPDFGTKSLRTTGVFGSAEIEDYQYVVAAATPLNSGERCGLGVIPAGYRVVDIALLWTGTAPGGGVTSSLGFDPLPPGSVPAANFTYWLNAVATAAAARVAAPNVVPITFDRSVRLVLTIGGANVAAGAIVTALVNMRRIGFS